VKRYFVIFILLMCLLPAFPAQGAGPLDRVQEEVNKVLAVLRDTQINEETKKEKLEAIYKEMFDEVEFSRRTLGVHWKQLAPAQQQEFIPLFREVLEKAYINKILAYKNEKIVFVKENLTSSNLAEVQTKVLTSSQEVPINYRVILKDGIWRVYDVVVENVSLILNYRSQFNSILAKNTPEQMLAILRKKAEGK
jgi:phospholipid transport system substrate-binding protein